MIEIKIPTSAAVLLLTERMREELEMRENCGMIEAGIGLGNLPFNEIFDITESAVVDIVSLLPLQVLMEDNNLSEIITKAVRQLSKIYNKEQFLLYEKEDAERLMAPILDLIPDADKEENFKYN